MGEIEDNATEFKVGKKVGRRAKVKNATKMTYKGLEFDSKLEYNCYLLLEASGLEFVFKPEKIVLVPGFTTQVLEHTKENLKKLRAEVRDWGPSQEFIDRRLKDEATIKLYKAECKRNQSRAKRLFNVKNRKILVDKKILPVTWSPDFYLPEYKLYVESKGFANDSFPIKFKAARWQLGNGMVMCECHVEWDYHDNKSAAEVGSKKELEDLIIYLKTKK